MPIQPALGDSWMEVHSTLDRVHMDDIVVGGVVCLPTTQSLINSVLQQDPDTRAALDGFAEKCAKKTTAKACQGKKSVSQLRSA